MTTGTEVVSGALRACSSLSPGEGIPGAEADYALAVLNGMLAAWSAESQMVPYRTTEALALPAGVGSRSIGAAGQLATARPDRVVDAFLRDASDQDWPIDVFMTREQYDAVPLKTTTARPRRLFYDPQYPSGVLYFDAVTDAAYTLNLVSLKPVAQFSSLAATVNLPGEYGEAIKYLLAERLAPEYGMPVSTDLRKLIEDARRHVRGKNLPRTAATFDPAVLPRRPYDIRAG